MATCHAAVGAHVSNGVICRRREPGRTGRLINVNVKQVKLFDDFLSPLKARKPRSHSSFLEPSDAPSQISLKKSSSSLKPIPLDELTRNVRDVTEKFGSMLALDGERSRTEQSSMERRRDGVDIFYRHAVAMSSMAMLTSSLMVAGPAMAGMDVGQTFGSEFQSGFASSFLLIIFSEIGDKTFFIAALLATRKSNILVFIGTFGALAVMTVISVLLGRVFHVVDEAFPIMFGESELPLDDIAAVILLIYFGVTTLLDAAAMETSKAEEEQQEAELAIASVGANSGATTIASVFALVFVAEWGDKSFFSTIALAAASSPAGVVAGAVAGHGIATVLAVLGGAFLGTYVSEKVIAYTGGALFLVFAAVTSVEIWSKLSP